MIYCILASCIVGADLYFKRQIEVRPDTAFPIHLKGGVRLEKHHNRGFLLNRLEDHPGLVRIVSVMTLLPLIFWFFHLIIKKAGALEKLGAACLLGGAVSNVQDRLIRGYVVDYLRLPIKKIRNIIFNIADFFLFLGALLTAVSAFFSK